MTTTLPAPVQDTHEDGRRWYVFGEGTDHEQRYLSVTTALKAVARDALVPWAAGLAAAAAFAELPTVVTASLVRPCGNTWSQCRRKNGGHDWRDRCDRCPCARCQACVAKWLQDRHLAESSRRAEEGKRTHDVIEHWVLHDGRWPDYRSDIEPYVAAFRAFVAEYGLRPDSWQLAEAIVINRAEGYAGTCDGVIRFHADRTPAAADLVARTLGISVDEAVAGGRHADLVVDFKTREKPLTETSPTPKFYPDQALQLVGYRNAPTVHIRATGVEAPMPGTDGALLVQLRPDGCTPRLVVANDETFKAFLCALWLYRWLTEFGTASVSVRSFPLPKPAKATRRLAAVPDPDAPAKPAKKATARKSTARKASTAARSAGEEKTVAARKAAVTTTSRGLAQRVLGVADPHPDSPYGDNIPF